MTIGTLNEGPLHVALKEHYLDLYSKERRSTKSESREITPGVELEFPVGGFVADIKMPDEVLYEIQTSSFGSIRRKLESLLESHQVVLVHPIAVQKYIIKLPLNEDDEANRRRSPKRQRLAHLLSELVRLPLLLNHPNFTLEVLLIIEEEIREFAPKKVRRRGGWRIVQRRLVEVQERHRFGSGADLFTLLTDPLPDIFSTAHLALAMGEDRWLGQKLAYCLRTLGAIELCGKEGNALLYRKVDST